MRQAPLPRRSCTGPRPSARALSRRVALGHHDHRGADVQARPRLGRPFLLPDVDPDHLRSRRAEVGQRHAARAGAAVRLDGTLRRGRAGCGRKRVAGDLGPARLRPQAQLLDLHRLSDRDGGDDRGRDPDRRCAEGLSRIVSWIVSVGDVELFVHEQGEGRALVALHGGPGLDGSFWFPGLDPLASEGWRILAPDLRANGRSQRGRPGSLDGAADGRRCRGADRGARARAARRHGLVVRLLRRAEPHGPARDGGRLRADGHDRRAGSARAGGRRAGPVRARAPARAGDSSWARERTSRRPRNASGSSTTRWPFHLADPESPLVQN